MSDEDEVHAEFRQVVGGIDREILSELSALNEDERDLVAAGLTQVGGIVGAVCQRVLDEWDGLDAQGRVAALLMIANALANVSA